MKTQEAIFNAFNTHEKEKGKDNVFIPNQITHGQRKAFFTNFNEKLLARISEIKANKLN